MYEIRYHSRFLNFRFGETSNGLGRFNDTVIGIKFKEDFALNTDEQTMYDLVLINRKLSALGEETYMSR